MNRWHQTGTIIITVALILIVLFSGAALYSVYSGDKDRESAAIEAVIDKALLQCYALEGSYPSDIEYLADNYGIILNENNYFYYYEPFGANIFPEVKVIKK